MSDFSSMSDEELNAIASGPAASPPPAAASPAAAPAAPAALASSTAAPQPNTGGQFDHMSDAELAAISSSAPATDPTRPQFANGGSPDTALNKPLMSAAETFSKIGVADKAGAMRTLQAQYGTENVVPDKTTGFPSKIKNPTDGLWYNVDPKSPWEKSWEAVKTIASGLGKETASAEDKKKVRDAAGALGGAAALGVGVLAGGLAAASNKMVGVFSNEAPIESSPFKIADKLIEGLGGNEEAQMATRSIAAHPYENANLAAQTVLGIRGAALGAKALMGSSFAVAASLSGTRTLLGKLEGTYDGDSIDMVGESALEGVLNMAGTGVGLGIMPTAKWLADKGITTSVGKMLSGLSSENLSIFKATIGMTAKLEPEVIDTLARDGSMVHGFVKEVASMGHDNAKQAFGARSANRVVKFGQGLGDALSEIYTGQTKSLVTNAPKNFDLQPVHVIDDMMHSFMRDDKLVRVVDKAGSVLESADTMNMLARNDGKLAKGFGWEMTPRSELMKQAASDPSMSKFAKEVVKSNDAHSAFQSYINELNVTRSFAPAKSAEDKMRSILDLRSSLNNSTWKTKMSADANGERAIASKVAEMSSTLDSTLETHLKPFGESMVKSFKDINASYSAIKQTGEQFLQAAKDGPSSAAAMRMSRSISRDSTVGDALAFEQIEALQSALHQHGGSVGQAAAGDLAHAVRVGQAERAAVSFSAPVKWGVSNLGIGGLALASPVSALAKGAVIGASVAIQSPKNAMRIAGANLATARFFQRAGFSEMGNAVGQMGQAPKVVTDALRNQTVNQFMPVLGKMYINMTHTPQLMSDHLTSAVVSTRGVPPK